MQTNAIDQIYLTEKGVLADTLRRTDLSYLDRAPAISRWFRIADAETSISKVYFIEAVGLQRIKIGVSTNVGRRRRQLECSSPAKLVLIGCISGTTITERYLHLAFRAWRVNREWFDFAADLQRIVYEILAGGHALDITGQSIMDRRYGA